MSFCSKLRSPHDKAQDGLALIKEAVIDYLTAHPNGVRKCDVARDLELFCDPDGKHRQIIPDRVLEILKHEKKVRKDPEHKLWFLEMNPNQ